MNACETWGQTLKEFRSKVKACKVGLYEIPQNKQSLKKKLKEESFPKWLRYSFIVIAILALLTIIFGKQGPQRTTFPSHVPKTR